MVWSNAQSPAIWALVADQHGVVSRAQLLARGVTRRGIEHRLAVGKLRSVYRGVYVVGRPELSRNGRWMAAVLVPAGRAPRPNGITVHRRNGALDGDRAVEHKIPSPAQLAPSSTWRHG